MTSSNGPQWDGSPRRAHIGTRDPLPVRRHNLRSVHAVVRYWLASRETQQDGPGGAFAGQAGSSWLGPMLDAAADRVGRLRATGSEVPCRDDGWIWRATRIGSRTRDEVALLVDELMAGLTRPQRMVLELCEQGTRWQAVQVLTERGVRTGVGGLPTERYVRRQIDEATASMLASPHWTELQRMGE